MKHTLNDMCAVDGDGDDSNVVINIWSEPECDVTTSGVTPATTTATSEPV